jgi:predicted DsbA family dithiol-disulfide isomerase
VKVEIYSDIACPWCYVGKARFERALAAFPQGSSVEVVYKPFQLDPGAPQQPRVHHEVLAAKYGPRARAMDAQVAALGAEEGIAFDFDTVLENNSLLAHRLLRFALDRYGAAAQNRLKGRLMAGHFGEGMDIGDRSQRAAAAAAAGLARGAAAAFLDGDELREEVLQEIDEARRMGVTAVPTFVFEGTWAVQGGQPTSTFLQALEQVAARSAAAPTAPESAEDAQEAPDAQDCAAGACEVPRAPERAARQAGG